MMLNFVIYTCIVFVVSAANQEDYSDFKAKEKALFERAIVIYKNKIDEAVKYYERNFFSTTVILPERMTNMLETLITLSETAQTEILNLLKDGGAPRYRKCQLLVSAIIKKLSDVSEDVLSCPYRSKKLTLIKEHAALGKKRMQNNLEDGQRCDPEDGYPVVDYIRCLRRKRNQAFEHYLDTTMTMEYDYNMAEENSNSNNQCDLETHVQNYKSFIASSMSDFRKCLEIPEITMMLLPKNI